ncbi:type II toxin-antitoxin system HicB family antitoxin [Enterobacter sp. R1(2018)]|uniref:type II toxin-antitoxin system HicB family antitoxin n=1 Tax=Enterobacter sp. R1(2018) TaxID=2447891 RepID=UPI000EB33943|nr:type II toxin-antitoxin system HicB family antitoxin [Enterobacter sp. R1(2018)]RKQ41437.1 CopG family transcriptional regulator [Enterobacter sp. R1(2018)]
MFFSVGVEMPTNENEAYGLIAPALCNDEFGCVSAADKQEDIAENMREAILLTADMMMRRGADITRLNDAGPFAYAGEPDYAWCNQWLMVDVDLSALEGKQQRINITLPGTLLQRIDNHVKRADSAYRDRSHFLAAAARHELQNAATGTPPGSKTGQG